MTTILYTDPTSLPRNGSGKAMPFATLTFLRSGTDIVLNEYTADSAGVFASITPAFSTYTYRVQLRDSQGVLRYDVDPYLPADDQTAYYDAQVQAIGSDGEVVPGQQLTITVLGDVADIFADSAMLHPLPNPITADASGLYPPIYMVPADAPVVYDYVDLPLTFDLLQTYTGVASTVNSGVVVPVADGLVVSGGRTRFTANVITTSNYFNRLPYAVQWSIRPSDAIQTINGSSAVLPIVRQEQQSAVSQLTMEYSNLGVTATTSMISTEGWITYGLMDNGARRRLARHGYRFEWRRHDNPLNGQTKVYVQACKVYGENIVYSVHANDTMSKVYEVDPATGDVLRSFTTTSYVHISGISKSQAGDYYFVDFDDVTNSVLVKFDLEQSLATGALVVIWTATLRVQDGSMEFFTHAGTDYFCIAQFSLANTDQLTRVWPVTVLASGWVASSSAPAKTWTNNGRTQGLRMYGGYLYESNNAASDALNSTRYGCIFKLDIATHMTSGSAAADFTTFLTASYAGPSGYPEELDFDADGRMYVGTESMIVFDDNLAGFSGVWSCPAAELGQSQENTYTFNLTFPSPGNISADVYLNGRLFETASASYTNAGATQSSIVVGVVTGGDTATADYAANFDGFVRRIHMRSGALTTGQMVYIMEGSTEPDVLTASTVSITNPGAESTITGWTAETGGLANRAATPSPYEGASYFTGGNNLETLARQRFDLLSVTGLANQTLLDAAGLRTYVSWHQACFSATDDDARMGIRYLSPVPVQLSQTEADRSRPAQSLKWFKRHFAVNADTNSRYVDLLMHMDRNGGTANDGYIDTIQSVVYRAIP